MELASLQGQIVRGATHVATSKEDLIADAKERAARFNRLETDKAETDRALLFEAFDLALLIRDIMDLEDVSAAEVARRIGMDTPAQRRKAQDLRKLADVVPEHRKDILDNEGQEDYQYPAWRDLVPRVARDDVCHDAGPRLREIGRQLVAEFNKPKKQRDQTLIARLEAEQAGLRNPVAPGVQPVPTVDVAALHVENEALKAKLAEHEQRKMRADRPQNDNIYTRPEFAARVIDYFNPTGMVVDPCRGDGAFYDNLKDRYGITLDWYEIREGRDFLDHDQPIDWLIANIPWSHGAYRKISCHAFKHATNVVLLVRYQNAVSIADMQNDFLRHGHARKEVIHVDWKDAFGDGKAAEGFELVVIHWQRGWTGGVTETWWRQRPYYRDLIAAPVVQPVPAVDVAAMLAELETSRQRETHLQAQVSALTERLKKARHGHYGRGTQEVSTPRWLYEHFDRIYHITCDAAASKENHKHPNFFDKEKDGLKQPWSGIVWINPPWNDILPWMIKAREFVQSGGTVVALLPFWKDTDWWDIAKHGRIWFLARVAFEGFKSPLVYPCMIVVLTKDSQIRDGRLHVVDQDILDPTKTGKRRKANIVKTEVSR